MEIVAAHLKKDSPMRTPYALLDLSSCSPDEIQWLRKRKVISMPIFCRILIALRQNHLEQAFVQFDPQRQDQRELQKEIEKRRMLHGFSVWIEKDGHTILHPEISRRSNDRGVFWVNPQFLVNGIYLHEFEEAMNNMSDMASVANTVGVAGEMQNCVWLSSRTLASLQSQKAGSLAAAVAGLSKQEIRLADPEAYGRSLQARGDIRPAEKLLFADVTRKKGGFLAKRINEPISLEIAKFCAYTPITPNQITFINTVLGVLSAWLVYYGAKMDLYWPMALGGILFYLVDIFDGIDGELARFTFQFSKRGALYDTISDNITLLAFLVAGTYAAYKQVDHWIAIALGIFTVAASIALILYLLWFTTRHFGNASLRLYEARFMPKIPRDTPFIRLIFWIRHLYTKDVLAALLTFAVVINMPILIVIGAPILLMMMFYGFVHMGIRFGHLLDRDAN